jgi:hypothetical protein
MFAKAKFLKKFVVVLAAALLFAAAGACVFKPLAIAAAKAQLRQTFPGSVVSIGGCVVKPDLLALRGLKVTNKEAYELAVKEAAARFSFLSLINGKIAEVEARGISITIHTPQKNSTDLQRLVSFSSGKSLFSIGRVLLSEVDTRIKTKDVEAKAFFSLELNPLGQTVSALDLQIDSFRGYGLEVSGVALSVREKAENGRLTIQKICYNNKLTVTDIESAVFLKKDIFSLSRLTALSLGGDISADVKLRLDKSLDYLANLSVRGISLDRLTGDLELEKRVQMSGMLGGEIGLRGQGQSIRFLNVDFSAAAPGGTLIITDAGFLDTIAKGSGQYLGAVAESFKNYRYAEGTARVYKEGEDYVLEVLLDGEQGKRNFRITVGFKQGG